MRKLWLALIASVAFALGACAPGGGGSDRTTGPTLNPSGTTGPGQTEPAGTDDGGDDGDDGGDDGDDDESPSTSP
jgi:hypothetical protein